MTTSSLKSATSVVTAVAAILCVTYLVGLGTDAEWRHRLVWPLIAIVALMAFLLVAKQRGGSDGR